MHVESAHVINDIIPGEDDKTTRKRLIIDRYNSSKQVTRNQSDCNIRRGFRLCRIKTEAEIRADNFITR